MVDYFGSSEDDNLIGTSGDDNFTSGGGMDTILGNAGNDLLILDGAIFAGSIFDGGDNDDTLRITAAAATTIIDPALAPFADLTTSTVSGIETIHFASTAGFQLNSRISASQLAGVTTLEGGDGSDLLEQFSTVLNRGGIPAECDF